MGSLRVRALDPERELDAFLALRNATRMGNLDRERWLETEARAPASSLRRNLVGGLDGRMVAVASVADDEFVTNCVSAFVATGPGHRRRGHGRAMLAAVEEVVAERRPAEVRTATRDDDGESRAWAERRGFAVFDHTFRSRVDLDAFDPAPHRGAVERAEASGLRFHRFGAADDPELLFDLFVRLFRDVPDQTEPPDRSYFQREVADLEGMISVLAYDGDTPVGLATLLPLQAGEYLNALTGVLPEYRGRGLARALKVVSGEAVRETGRRYVVTNNNARNAPMLAVNDALGFVRQVGLLHLRRRTPTV